MPRQRDVESSLSSASPRKSLANEMTGNPIAARTRFMEHCAYLIDPFWFDALMKLAVNIDWLVIVIYLLESEHIRR